MNIYFAGSIRGNPQGKELYPLIIDELKKYGNVLTEMYGRSHRTDVPNQGRSDQAIFTDDVDKLDQSDIIVAEVTGPSLGCGREICYGQCVRQIPIICLYLDGTNLSAMIKGNDYLHLSPYTPETMIDVIDRSMKTIIPIH